MSEPLSDWLYDTSFMAGMNQDYYQTMVIFWAFIATSLKVLVVLLSFASAGFALWELKADKGEAPQVKTKRWFAWLLRRLWIFPRLPYSLNLSILSAAAAIVLVIAPADDRYSTYKSLYHSWTSIRGLVDNMSIDAESASDDNEGQFRLARRQINAQIIELEKEEPDPWTFLVERCYEAEVKRRTRDERDQGGSDDAANLAFRSEGKSTH